jgi:hypothetical protein
MLKLLIPSFWPCGKVLELHQSTSSHLAADTVVYEAPWRNNDERPLNVESFLASLATIKSQCM